MDTKFNISILDKFIGREVSVIKEEVNVSREPTDGDQVITAPKVFHYTLDANNPVLDEIRSLTEGFKLRTWLPNSIGTMDLRTNRINIKFNQNNDTFTIKSFNIG